MLHFEHLILFNHFVWSIWRPNKERCKSRSSIDRKIQLECLFEQITKNLRSQGPLNADHEIERRSGFCELIDLRSLSTLNVYQIGIWFYSALTLEVNAKLLQKWHCKNWLSYDIAKKLISATKFSWRLKKVDNLLRLPQQALLTNLFIDESRSFCGDWNKRLFFSINRK